MTSIIFFQDSKHSQNDDQKIQKNIEEMMDDG